MPTDMTPASPTIAVGDVPDPALAQGSLTAMVLADQLAAVRRSLLALVFSSTAVGAATAGVALYSSTGWGGPSAWFLLVVASNACRVFVCASAPSTATPHGRSDARESARQLRLVAASSFLSGCVWALLPLFCSSDAPAETLFFMTVICGVCAGSVIYSAAVAAVPVAFVSPALASMAVWCMAAGGFHYQALAIMGLVYLAALVHASIRGGRAFRDSSRLKNEALFLAAELRQSHDRLTHAAQELDFRANHDSLTGLFNREGFFEATARRGTRAGERRQQAALMLDLDGFKAVNDAFGHQAGDRVLGDVGHWLQDRLAPYEAIVGRWGGDEFAVLYQPRSADDSPEHVARHLIGTIAEATSQVGGRVGVSAGICTDHDCSVAEMLSFADEALYEAKRLGRNRCHRFDEALHARLLRRRDIERDLVEAMASRSVCVWYQPILDQGGRKLHSLEALLRWHHPRHGWVPPGEVIFAAASTGLAERLLRHILHEVCSGIEELAAAGGRFDAVPVAMNVSPREMSQLPVDKIVLEVLAQRGIPTLRLQIEVTEEIALDTSSAMARLQSLSDAGIAIVIDDFGVGYSSLASLRGAHVRQVKIDRSFILDLASSPESRLMVESVIRLGQALRIEVVAEGIESKSELEALTAMGCQLVQGYYFMRPATLARVVAWAGKAEATT